MAFSLTGKVALVTGASSGLGQHMAKTLARAGASVAVAARSGDKLRQLVDDLAENVPGSVAHAVQLDVTDTPAIAPAIAEIESTLGPVTILVNNAGMSIDGPALNMAPEAFDAVFALNTKAPYFVAQAVARRLVDLELRGGSIINIASLATIRFVSGISPYAASKSAIDQLTRALAREWARHEIRVNSLLPGYIETEINREFFASEPGQALIHKMPRRRLCPIEALDGPLLLLASDAGSGMTGSSLLVDDGQVHGRY